MFNRDQPDSPAATGTWLCLLVLHNQTSSPSFNIIKFKWYCINVLNYFQIIYMKNKYPQDEIVPINTQRSSKIRIAYDVKISIKLIE